jgi:outer membrane protein OmpA-like peptidoglycan-associated protein
MANNQNDVSHTFTDLMTSLAVIFILLLVATINNASADSETAKEDLKKQVTDILKELHLTITEDPMDPLTQIINLDGNKVKFANNSHDLNPEGRELLKNLFAVLTPKLCEEFLYSRLESVIIEGHTNSVGDTNTEGKLKNIKLSQDRAYAVMSEAFPQGADSSQIECLRKLASATGRGSNRPLPGKSLEDESNRRVEVKIRVRSDFKVIEEMLVESK